MADAQKLDRPIAGLQIGGFKFVQLWTGDVAQVRVEYPSFILMKDPNNVETYRRHLARPLDNILELGIMQGGSCAFFEALLAPRNHLAIDINPMNADGVAHLARHISAQGRRFRADYKTSQADIARILELWKELAGQTSRFNLIVDDASHNYDLSLASFNGLFPHLVPGGLYALEDWGWAHWGGMWQTPDNPEFGNAALSNLVVHCVLATTTGAGIVEDVTVTPNVTFIKRGPAECFGLKIEESYPNRRRSRRLL